MHTACIVASTWVLLHTYTSVTSHAACEFFEHNMLHDLFTLLLFLYIHRESVQHHKEVEMIADVHHLRLASIQLTILTRHFTQVVWM